MVMCIMYECTCPEIFRTFPTNTVPHLPTFSATVPASPLYSIDASLEQLKDVPICAPQTYSILLDMKRLTDAFLLHYGEPTSDSDSSIGLSDDNGLFICLQEAQNRLSSCLPGELEDLPSFAVHHYEFVRLAATLYTEALFRRVPLSAACSRLPPDSSDTSSIAAAMWNALAKTDLSHCWGGMVGVLLWGCLVGTSATNGLSGATMEMQRQNEQVRKWLTLACLGCTVLLATEHSIALEQGVQTMLEIQRHLVK
jgi:hypothetical protein